MPQTEQKLSKSPLRISLAVIWTIFMLFVEFWGFFIVLIASEDDGGCIFNDYSANYNLGPDDLCVFTMEFKVIASVIYTVLYLLHDVVRRYILKFNPSVLCHIVEVLILFILYFLFFMDWVPPMFLKSVAHALQLFLPFFILAAGVQYISSRIIWILIGLITCFLFSPLIYISVWVLFHVD